MGIFDRLFGDPANPNRRLEKLMAELARGDEPKTREAFYRELLASTLRVATPGAIGSDRLPEGPSTATAQTKIPFISNKDGQGNSMMLAFTGDEGLLAWRPAGCDTVELKTKDLCAMALGAGIHLVLINPAGPSGGRLAGEEMQALSEGREPDFVGKKKSSAGPLEFRAPREAPASGLVEVLRLEAGRHKGIVAAYLIEARIDGEDGLRVALELDEKTRPEPTVPEFIEGAARSMGGAALPDVLVLPGGADLKAAVKKAGLLVFSRD